MMAQLTGDINGRRLSASAATLTRPSVLPVLLMLVLSASSSVRVQGAIIAVSPGGNALQVGTVRHSFMIASNPYTMHTFCVHTTCISIYVRSEHRVWLHGVSFGCLRMMAINSAASALFRGIGEQIVLLKQVNRYFF